jgi:magnesium and cobalt transporter
VDDDETAIQPAGKGRYTVRGLTPIEDFNEYFGCNFSDEEFDTVAGMVMGAFGHMPKRTEQIELNGYRFSVLRADSRRLYLLEVMPLETFVSKAEESGSSDASPT